MSLLKLLPELVAVAETAGREIMRHYSEKAAPMQKADGSPVTAADHASEAVILAALARLDPDALVLSEEEAAAGRAPVVGTARYWCVDPLDGTKEFVNGTDEFTVCIGALENFRPIFGVLHAPALGLTFGAAEGKAWQYRDGVAHPIAVRSQPPGGGVALVSRSHRDNGNLAAYLVEQGITEKRRMGSAAKFGLVANGEADIYARFGPTSEWDTAAGQAVLEAAGGSIVTQDGAPFTYGKPEFRNPGFIARGRQ